MVGEVVRFADLSSTRSNEGRTPKGVRFQLSGFRRSFVA